MKKAPKPPVVSAVQWYATWHFAVMRSDTRVGYPVQVFWEGQQVISGWSNIAAAEEYLMMPYPPPFLRKHGLVRALGGR